MNNAERRQRKHYIEVLEHINNGMGLRDACAEVGISTSTYYLSKYKFQNDEKFSVPEYSAELIENPKNKTKKIKKNVTFSDDTLFTNDTANTITAPTGKVLKYSSTDIPTTRRKSSSSFKSNTRSKKSAPVSRKNLIDQAKELMKGIL